MDRFCLEYAGSGNAKKSAENAGYSKKTAYSQGQRLLKNVEVASRLHELAKEMESEKIAQGKELQERLTDIIRMNTKAEVVVNEFLGEGISQPTVVEKNADLKDVIKAIETLGKMQGLFDKTIHLDIQRPIFEDDLEE